jgi:phthalate 4,5-dioxygenase
MLKREDNELLTRTGPATPMGQLMRRFWIPFMLDRELAEPDGAPLRVRLLGEDLVAFRDSDGRVGLLDEHCPHRRASLFFGRNEGCGLRCVYHGWKFDVAGNCIDLPSEPPGSTLQRKVKATAYPVREAGGVLWAYLGPPDLMGELPAFEWISLGAEHRHASRWVQECNYLQTLEGEIDSAHVSFLHRRLDQLDPSKTAIRGALFRDDTAPTWRVDETQYGLVLAARRNADDGRSYWRMNQFLLPFFSMIAPDIGGPHTARMWVPRDDESCFAICVTYHPQRALTAAERAAYEAGEVGHALLIPGTTRMRANRDNDYLIDRQMQKTAHFSGIDGVRAQDAAMTESQGRIVDRSLEHLGSSDTAIIAMRKLLLRSARELAGGKEPPAARGGRLYAVRSWSALLAGDARYDEDEGVRRAMVTA